MGQIFSTWAGNVERRRMIRTVAVLVGIISDTHGLLRPEAMAALAEMELIIHAGDTGTPSILESLSAIAPVYAVRGNIDTGDWARTLPESREIEIEGVKVFLIHNRKDIRSVPEGVTAVISGHTHRAREERRNGILYLNPGSAGPRRFKLPVTLMRAVVDGTAIHSELVQLGV